MEEESSSLSPPGAKKLTPIIGRYLPNIIYGANDGVITTFVVISGAAGAALSPKVVIILGLANLLADGFSMGTSNVLSVRTTPTAESRPSLSNASRHGIATFLAFVIAGSLPLSAYLIPHLEPNRFELACVLSSVTLFAVGAARAAFSERPAPIAGLEMLVLGILAGAVAYGVGALAAIVVG
jgi:vacuolar iron transporter family protein